MIPNAYTHSENQLRHHQWSDKALGNAVIQGDCGVMHRGYGDAVRIWGCSHTLRLCTVKNKTKELLRKAKQNIKPTMQ